MPSVLIPLINGKGIQASADGLASRRTVWKAGAEAKLGPESYIPFIMLYLTSSIVKSLTLLPSLGKLPGHKSLVCATKLRTRSFCKRGIATEHGPPDLIHHGGGRTC